MIDDVRRLSTALSTLADDADQRLAPGDAERATGGEDEHGAAGQEGDQEPSA